MTAVGELITPTGRLVMTAEDMNADHARWLKLRDWREGVPGGYCIGASDVPSILDLDGVDTPAHVYHTKRTGYRTPVNEAMTFGKLFEGPIAGEWCRRNRAVIDEIGLVARDETPWAQATIDRRVRECPVYKDTPAGECLLEVKHVEFVSTSRWQAGIPDRILAQILFQLWVTGYGHGHYACKVPGGMKQGIIYADREVDLMKYIVTEVERFRTEHLIAGVEPAWNISTKAARLLELDKAMHPDRVGVLSIDGMDDVLAYAEAQRDESAAKKRKEQAAARLAQLADGHEIVTIADERAYWYGTTSTTRVNVDALAERYPDAFADPEVVRETVSHPIHIDRAYKKMIQ